ncbi:MAG TPA: polysaccharide biosynthesis C-terminal domain-containing protein [Longimicrobiaceae bacterium]|nr:polysaccharide biosynthesis C-terminal domain-containing protein [Longimicrobiaceae bacterium]
MSLAKKSFALLRQDAFLFVANLATGVIVARQLGPTSYGLWAILQLIPTYAEAFVRLKVDAAGVYLIGSGRYGVGPVRTMLNRIALGSGLGVVALVAAALGPLSDWLFGAAAGDVRPAILVVALQVPFQFLLLNYTKLLLLREDVRAYNQAVLLRTLSFAVLSVTLLFGARLGLLGVVFAGTASTALACLFAMRALGAGPAGGERSAPGLGRALVEQALPLYGAGIVGHLHTYSSSTVVALYLSPANVGFLAMAQNLGRLLERITEALNLLLFPRIAGMEEGASLAELVVRAYRVMLVATLVAGTGMAVAVRPLVELVYGRDFLPAVVPLWIILPGVVAFSASTVFTQYLVGIGKAGLALRISIVPLVVQVALALLLVPRFGLAGAACALSVASVLVAVLQLAVFVHVARPHVRASDLLVRAEDVRTVLHFAFGQLAGIRGRVRSRRGAAAPPLGPDLDR